VTNAYSPPLERSARHEGASSHVYDLLWAALSTLLHLVPWAVLAGTYLLVVPKFEQTFADFDLQLPAITILVLWMSHFIISHWWVVCFVVPPAMVSDLIVVYWCRRHRANALVRLAWSLLVWGLPLLHLAVTAFGIWIPLSRLIVSLS